MKLILVLVVIAQFSDGLADDLKAEETGYGQPPPPPAPPVPPRPAPKIHYTSYGTQQPTAYANSYGFHSSYNNQGKNVKNYDSDNKSRPAVRLNLGYAPAPVNKPLTYGQAHVLAHKPVTVTYPATSFQPFVPHPTSKPLTISYAPPAPVRPHYLVPGQHPDHSGAVVKTFLNRPSYGYSHTSLGYNNGDEKDEDNDSKEEYQTGYLNRPLPHAAVPKRTYGYAAVVNSHAPANRYAYGHVPAPVYGQVHVPTYGYAPSPAYTHIPAAALTHATSYDSDNEKDKSNYPRAHGSYHVLTPVRGYVQPIGQQVLYH